MINFINFLNIPSVRLRKSNANYQYLYDLFVTKENERVNWKQDCLDAYFSCDIKRLKELSIGKHINFDTYFIDLLINRFGSNESNLYYPIIELLTSPEIKSVKNVEIENNSLIIRTNKGTINAYRFSDLYIPLVKIFPDLSKITNRKKQCHNLSIKLILNADFDCKIATGYVSNFSKNSYYLHSWVETTVNNKCYVIDLTKNIIMNKEGYYQIQNISGPVYKIPQSTFKQEREIFNSIASYNGPLAKLYLSNRPLALEIFEEEKLKNNILNNRVLRVIK